MRGRRRKPGHKRGKKYYGRKKRGTVSNSGLGQLGSAAGMGANGVAGNPLSQQNWAGQQEDLQSMLQGIGQVMPEIYQSPAARALDPEMFEAVKAFMTGNRSDPRAPVPEPVVENVSGPMDAIVKNRPRKLRINP